MLCVHFLDKEGDNLSLIDVTVVRINLDKRLHEALCLLRKACAVNALHDFQEVITVDDALVDLLIIFLQFSEHLVDFLCKTRLKTIKAGL